MATNEYKILNDRNNNIVFELFGYYSLDDLNVMITESKTLIFCSHDWEGTWLSDELEGFRCKKCGFEALDVDSEEIDKL